MFTETGAAVDSGGGGVWKTQAEIARIKSTTRQNIAKKVKRLEAEGLLEVKRDGAQKLVNLVQFDRALGEAGDPAKQLAAQLARSDDGGADGDSYQKARADKERYNAELARLDLAERQGKLRPVDEIADALSAIGREVFQSADSMIAARAEELFGLAKKDDLAGFRKRLQTIVRDWATATAEKMADVAAQENGE